MLNDKGRQNVDEEANADESEERTIKRVCLYCIASQNDFVHTDEFLSQQLLVVDLINNTPGWQYERIFMDINGEHKAFADMIGDCENGRFDIIVTKSILHFAGSLTETLKVTDRLAALDPPVEVIFTDEAMFSLDRERIRELYDKLMGNQKK